MSDQTLYEHAAGPCAACGRPHQLHTWPASYDQNDIEHVLGQHQQSPRRDCGHCAWFFAPPPVVTRRMMRSIRVEG